jgi:hypothetical protein
VRSDRRHGDEAGDLLDRVLTTSVFGASSAIDGTDDVRVHANTRIFADVTMPSGRKHQYPVVCVDTPSVPSLNTVRASVVATTFDRLNVSVPVPSADRARDVRRSTATRRSGSRPSTLRGEPVHRR